MEEQQFLIFRYLDGDASDKEKKQVEQLLKTDEQFLILFQELKSADDFFKNQEPESPKKKFTQSVMKAISPERNINFFDSTFLSVLGGLIVLLVLVFSYQMYVNGNSFIPQQYTSYILPSIAVLFFFGLVEFILDFRAKQIDS